MSARCGRMNGKRFARVEVAREQRVEQRRRAAARIHRDAVAQRRLRDHRRGRKRRSADGDEPRRRAAPARTARESPPHRHAPREHARRVRRRERRAAEQRRMAFGQAEPRRPRPSTCRRPTARSRACAGTSTASSVLPPPTSRTATGSSPPQLPASRRETSRSLLHRRERMCGSTPVSAAHGGREVVAVGRAAHRARRDARDCAPVLAHGVHVVGDRGERAFARVGIEPAASAASPVPSRVPRDSAASVSLAVEDEQPRGVRPDRDQRPWQRTLVALGFGRLAGLADRFERAVVSARARSRRRACR